MGDGLVLPSTEALRAHVRGALAGVWSNGADAVAALPIPALGAIAVNGPLRLVEVRLPDWAIDDGVDGVLLVPAEVRGSWDAVDWWTALFMLLECWHERAWELVHGPVHSYSNRLAGWDERAWQRAWVNRIARFMARWADIAPSPISPTVQLSHDVDAVSKTTPIRLKQGAMRVLVNVRRRQASRTGTGWFRFAFGHDEWNCVDDVLAIERAHGLSAVFHVFADPRRRSPFRWLMDPGYRLDSDEGQAMLTALKASGVTIGLHPSFDSWNDGRLMAEQRSWLEEHTGGDVRAVRQHWLRFSWAHTWAAQAEAGLRHDSTLMFNDRAGFRNSAALTWRPWNHLRAATHDLEATPCTFMDSHQYDYDVIAAGTAPRVDAAAVTAECSNVEGTMQVLWHPHSLSADYGWRPGFENLVETLV